VNFCKILLSKITKCEDNFFRDIVGYDHIKKLFRMALDSDSATHILLVGPPASAKTMFLTSLMHELKSCYFADGTNSTKAGMIDYLFENRPQYMLLDEIDKMFPKHRAFLLNLMETGIISETKYGKTRLAEIMTSVFATCNEIKKISAPLMSRFFIVELELYTYEQFCDIAQALLSRHKIGVEVASMIAEVSRC
jgi:MoxR-like ATPase